MTGYVLEFIDNDCNYDCLWFESKRILERYLKTHNTEKAPFVRYKVFTAYEWEHSAKEEL